MEEFIQVSSKDFRGSWKAYNKKNSSRISD
jgi:hypothetical protein